MAVEEEPEIKKASIDITSPIDPLALPGNGASSRLRLKAGSGVSESDADGS